MLGIHQHARDCHHQYFIHELGAQEFPLRGVLPMQNFIIVMWRQFAVRNVLNENSAGYERWSIRFRR
jgi:hypothetical protein